MLSRKNAGRKFPKIPSGAPAGQRQKKLFACGPQKLVDSVNKKFQIIETKGGPHVQEFVVNNVGMISETMELMVQNISPLQEPGRYRRFLTEYIRGDKEGGMSFYHLNKILLGMGEKPIYLAEFKEYLWHMSLHHAKNIMQRPPIGNW
ncbi:MAG TPA: hypothetical protein HA254_04130 [Candidatus Diapherotrites archaeon]|uniref:Uncharacterized protein n=1 Tax=Candidatus Iainarchaeum sp. TaxID=3101447 RepID=A0A7J4IWD6_9ARCH|nr:hypothetical protein [Candidatus Diapherotrites archaeon]